MKSKYFIYYSWTNNADTHKESSIIELLESSLTIEYVKEKIRYELATRYSINVRSSDIFIINMSRL